MTYRYNGPVHLAPTHFEVKFDIEWEADIAARKLGTQDWNERTPRDGAALKAAMIEAEQTLATGWQEHIKYSLKIQGAQITTNEERQQFASIYANKFYASYHARINRLQDEAERAWNEHELVFNR